MSFSYDPVQFKNAGSIEDLIIKKMPDGNLRCRTKERYCFCFNLMVKIWKGLFRPDERITTIRNVLMEYINEDIKIINKNIEKRSILYANLFIFNKKVIQRHNSSWISYFFWNRITEIDPFRLKILEDNIAGDLRIVHSALFDLNISQSSLEDQMTQLIKAYDILQATASVNHVEGSELQNQRRILNDLYEKKLTQHLNLLKGNIQLFEKITDWTAEDTCRLSNLMKLLQQSKPYILPELRRKILDLPNPLGDLLGIEQKLRREKEQVESLKAQMVNTLLTLERIVSSEPLNNLKFVGSCQDLSNSINKAQSFKWIDRNSKRELLNLHGTYLKLIAWYRKVVLFLPGFEKCDNKGLDKLTTDLNVLGEENFCLAGELGTLAEVDITGALVKRLYKCLLQLKEVNELGLAWLEIQKKSETTFISMKSFEKLRTRTMEICSLSDLQYNPMVQQVNETSQKVLSLIGKREEQLAHWKQYFATHSTNLINMVKESLFLSKKCRSLFPQFSMYKAAFTEFNDSFIDSDEKKEIIQDRQKFEGLILESKGALELAQKIRDLMSEMPLKINPQHLLKLDKILPENISPTYYIELQNMLNEAKSKVEEALVKEISQFQTRLETGREKIRSSLPETFSGVCSYLKEFCLALEQDLVRLSQFNLPGQVENLAAMKRSLQSFKGILDSYPVYLDSLEQLKRELENYTQTQNPSAISAKQPGGEQALLRIIGNTHSMAAEYNHWKTMHGNVLACIQAESELRKALEVLDSQSVSPEYLDKLPTTIERAKQAQKGIASYENDSVVNASVLSRRTVDLLEKAENKFHSGYKALQNERNDLSRILTTMRTDPRSDLKSLKFFTRSKKRECYFNRIQALLKHRWMTSMSSEEINHSLQLCFPEIVLKNAELMQKCAAFWKGGEAPKLNVDDLSKLEAVLKDIGLPVVLGKQLELIQRMHKLGFHPKTSCPISHIPVTDAVRAKSGAGIHYVNSSDITRIIYVSKKNPLTNSSISASELSDAPEISRLVNDWLMCKDLFLKPVEPKASFKTSFEAILAHIARVRPKNFKIDLLQYHPGDLTFHAIDTLKETARTNAFNPINQILHVNDFHETIQSHKVLFLKANYLMMDLYELLSKSPKPAYTETMPQIVMGMWQASEHLGLIYNIFCDMKSSSGKIQSHLGSLKERIWLLRTLLVNAEAFSAENLNQATVMGAGVLESAVMDLYEIMKVIDAGDSSSEFKALVPMFALGAAFDTSSKTVPADLKNLFRRIEAINIPNQNRSMSASYTGEQFFEQALNYRTRLNEKVGQLIHSLVLEIHQRIHATLMADYRREADRVQSSLGVKIYSK